MENERRRREGKQKTEKGRSPKKRGVLGRQGCSTTEARRGEESSGSLSVSQSLSRSRDDSEREGEKEKRKKKEREDRKKRGKARPSPSSAPLVLPHELNRR